MFGSAEIRDRAVVGGSAAVFDGAIICGDSLVDGSASVSGRALVYQNASILGDAEIVDALISGSALIGGSARVIGRIRLTGRTQLETSASILLQRHVLALEALGPFPVPVTVYRDSDHSARIVHRMRGHFDGPLSDFAAAVDYASQSWVMSDEERELALGDYARFHEYASQMIRTW